MCKMFHADATVRSKQYRTNGEGEFSVRNFDGERLFVLPIQIICIVSTDGPSGKYSFQGVTEIR